MAPRKTSEKAAATTGRSRVDVINLAKCGVDASKVLQFPVGTELPLLRISGKADGIKDQKNRATGEDMPILRGNFEAQNLQTGAIYYSVLAMLLQGGTQDVVEQPLEAAAIGGKSAVIPFGLDVFAIHSERVRDGKTKGFYEFKAVYWLEPEPAEEDPLADIRANAPALPAVPKADPEGDAEDVAEGDTAE